VVGQFQPDLATVQALAAKGLTVPIYREVPADLETPVSAYLKIAQGQYSFLLESVEGGERLGRYSFIGTTPSLVIRMEGGTATCYDGNGATSRPYRDPIRPIEEELARTHVATIPGLPRFQGGAVGYLSYEAAHYFEPRVPLPPDNQVPVPEAIFLFTDTLVVFDHVKHRMIILSHVRPNGDVAESYRRAAAEVEAVIARLQQPVSLPRGNGVTTEPVPNKTKAQHRQMVLRAKEYIVAGDIIQAVLGLRWACIPIPSTGRCA